MPNIEIHGRFENSNVPDLLGRRIFDLFTGKPYVTDMVVTFCGDHVCDVHGNEQPFIRLLNSCQEHTEEILKELETLNIDIEYLDLSGFIPKRS